MFSEKVELSRIELELETFQTGLFLLEMGLLRGRPLGLEKAQTFSTGLLKSLWKRGLASKVRDRNGKAFHSLHNS
jgi:hypothetical protein